MNNLILLNSGVEERYLGRLIGKTVTRRSNAAWKIFEIAGKPLELHLPQHDPRG